MKVVSPYKFITSRFTWFILGTFMATELYIVAILSFISFLVGLVQAGGIAATDDVVKFVAVEVFIVVIGMFLQYVSFHIGPIRYVDFVDNGESIFDRKGNDEV